MFCGLCFQNCLGRRKFGKNRVYLKFWRVRKINKVELIKINKVGEDYEHFLKIRLLEKIVDPPLLAIIMFQKVIGQRLHFVKSF